MAFGAVGSLGSTSEKPGAPGDTTIVLTVEATAEVGNVAVVAACMNNLGTAEGETTQISVEDSAGNSWIPVGGGSEYTLSSGAADDGIVVAVFATKVTSQIDSGSDTITITSSGNVTAKAMAAYEFTMGSGTLTFADAFFQATTSGTDPEAVSVSGLTSREYLLIHAIGEERGSTHTADADYTEVFDAVETTGGAAASNVSLFMAYRIATLTSDTVDAASSVDGDTSQVVAAFYEAVTGTTNEETGAAPADTIASATDVFEAAETGAAPADTVAAGADVFEAAETGAAPADTVASATDVFEAVETSAAAAGSIASGTSEKTAAGGTEYPKAGAGVAGSTSAAADVYEAVEAGSNPAGTVSAAADVFEAVEAGAGAADTILAGTSEHVSGGGTTYNKTGAAVAGSAGVAADANEFVEIGATYAGTLYVGADVFEATEAGVAAAATLLAGFEGDAVFATLFFDRPSPLGGADLGSPDATRYDRPTPAKVLV